MHAVLTVAGPSHTVLAWQDSPAPQECTQTGPQKGCDKRVATGWPRAPSSAGLLAGSLAGGRPVVSAWLTKSWDRRGSPKEPPLLGSFRV